MSTTVADFYPTRVADRPQILDRPDPVIWGDATGQDGPLTRQEVEQFDRDGFLFYPNVFYLKDIEAMKSELERLRLSAEVKESEESVVEPESDELRSIFNIHRSNELFERIARSPRIIEMIEQLLGSPIYIHQSRVNIKPGFEGKEFYWHSDFETWHAEDGMPRPRAISVSIWLEENTAFNGSLMVVPGSHKYFVSCVGETPAENYKQSLRQQRTGVPDNESMRTLVNRLGMDMPTGPAGSALFFESNLMHGSAGNISPWPRSNVFFCYNSVEHALVEPFGGTEPRPEFIASRDFAPIEPR